MHRLVLLAAFGMAITPSVSAARDSLGVYSQWAAFRDAEQPRCYAIAAPRGSGSNAFASVGTWPAKKVRGQVHFRLSRSADASKAVTLKIGDASFNLVAKGRNAWASDKGGDARIIAAMRSAKEMSVSARDAKGARFTDRYSLEGAATALDAAVVGCAKQG